MRAVLLLLLLLLRVSTCYHVKRLMRSSVLLPPLHSNADDYLTYMTSSNDIDSIPLAQLIQDDSPDVNVVLASIGSLLGQLHGSTYVDVIPTSLSDHYRNIYSSDEYSKRNEYNYFTKITDRLRDISLFQQTDDVNNYGDDHYSNVRNFLNDDIGVNDITILTESIAMIRQLLQTKSVAVISNNCNNITINTSSSSLASKVNINVDSRIYGPPGLDIGMVLATLAYNMPYNVNKEKYTNFENNIRIFWSNYNTSFVTYSGISDSDSSSSILQETLRDSVGFLGWYMFLLVTCYHIDVMPLPTTNDVNDTNQVRIRQLSISIEALRFFYKKKNFPNVDSTLKMFKLGLGKVYRV